MILQRNTLAAALAAIGILSATPAGAIVVFTGDAGVDAGNSSMFVGGAAAGNAAVSAPGPDVFSSISVGNDFLSGAAGSVTVSGAGAVLTATNAVGVGATGIGSMRVENGGVVNSLGGQSPFCPGCNFTIVGNGGGSTGTLVVTGAGSKFNVGDSLGTNARFVVANGNVDGGFGTANAPTNGQFSLLAGATASTLSTIIAASNGLDPNSNMGRSPSTGTVVVDGAGSVWSINAGTDFPAFISVGSGGTGALNITNGGRVETTHMQMGVSNGSSGSLRVEGAGSLLQMTGGNDSAGGAGFVAGWRPGSSGSVLVSDGGHVSIDGTGSGGVAGFALAGLYDAPGGTATMTVTGTGSLVEITDDSPSIAPAGFTVGQTGTAQLSVLAGGKIRVTDTSPDAFGSFSIGGNAAQGAAGLAPAGNGTLLVSGSGSAVEILSAHGSFVIGHTSGGSGTATVEQGGRIASASGIVGDASGSTGSLTIKGAGSRVDLAGDSFGYGSFLVVGNAGQGTLNVTDGGTLSIVASPTVALGGMAIGGTRDQPAAALGGTGIVNVARGGRILVSGDRTTHIKLGVHEGGNGVMTVTEGGQVSVGRPLDPNAPGDESGFYLGAAVGSSGIAVVSGAGSRIDAGVFLGIGVSVDKTSNMGTGVLTVRDGAVVTADTIRIGSGGVLNGNGKIQGNVVNAGGVIAPGNSPGTLTIEGSLVSSGLIDIEVAGLADGQFDVLNVLGDVNLQGSTVRFVFSGGFLPHAGDTFDFLTGTTTVNPLAGVAYAYAGAAAGFLYAVDPATGVFTAVNNAAPVPEPSVWMTLGLGMIGLGAWSYRRRASVLRA